MADFNMRRRVSTYDKEESTMRLSFRPILIRRPSRAISGWSCALLQQLGAQLVAGNYRLLPVALMPAASPNDGR